MTENEDLISRSTLLDSFRKCYSGHMGMENSDNMMMFKSICRIINDQEAIGTVEGYKRAIEVSKENYYLCAEYKAKLKEYEAIGTIEEFKDLKEKNNKDFELLLKAVKESYPMFKGAYVELDVFMGDVMRRFARDRQ